MNTPEMTLEKNCVSTEVKMDGVLGRTLLSRHHSRSFLNDMTFEMCFTNDCVERGTPEQEVSQVAPIGNSTSKDHANRITKQKSEV